MKDLEKIIVCTEEYLAHLKELNDDNENSRKTETIEAGTWMNKFVNTENLRQIEVSLEVNINKIGYIVIGTADKQVAEYHELTTATRFNPQGTMDNYAGNKKDYTNGTLPYGNKTYIVTVNIDLESQMYQSFLDGIAISDPVTFRTASDTINYVCIRGTDIPVSIGKLDVRTGRAIAKEEKKPLPVESDTRENGIAKILEDNGSVTEIKLSKYFTAQKEGKNGFKHPFYNETAYVEDANPLYKTVANQYFVASSLSSLKRRTAKVPITHAGDKEGNLLTWVAAAGYTFVRNYINGDRDKEKLDAAVDATYRTLTAVSVIHSPNDRLYGAWTLAHISRSLELLIHVIDYDFASNHNVPWNNVKDIKNTYMGFYNRFHNKDNWYYLGANWETSLILAFKSMSIVFEDREMYEKHNEVYGMLLKEYIFLKKDVVPRHPMRKEDLKGSLLGFMGGNRYGKNTYESLNLQYAYDENVAAGLVDKEDCLVSATGRKHGGWKIGLVKEHFSAFACVCMETFRDSTHSYMGTEGVCQLLKIMLIQGDTVPRDWLDRGIKAQETSAHIALGKRYKIFGNEKDAQFWEQMTSSTSAYGTTSLELAYELGTYDTSILERKVREINLPAYKNSGDAMSHCGTSAEVYGGLRN